MNSRFFIERPVFAAVLSIIIVLAGLVALKILPIAQYPEIAPPTVTITATYPGASAGRWPRRACPTRCAETARWWPSAA